MTNPYVFIVGCPRSGTTLLRHMVDAHPEITISPEAHWIPIWYNERRGLAPDGMVTPELITLLLDDPKFPLMQLGRDEILSLVRSGQPMSYASFVTGVLDLYGKARGKALVGNKTPDSARRMHTLHGLWPEARFIHLIRDGRDVALSLMAWPKVTQKKPGTFHTWKDDPVSTSALWWELNVRRGREAGASLGPGLYYEMRYESLVSNSADQCAALCSFLGLPFDDRMLGFYKTPPRSKARQNHWQPVTPGLRDWRTQMSVQDVERFEATVGGLLDELSYPRAFPRPRTEALERGSRIREELSRRPSWMNQPGNSTFQAHRNP